MESIKKFSDKFYEKIPGSYWGIGGGIFGLLVFLIAVVLHTLKVPYSIVSDPVSALGWGPNGSEPVFRVGLIVLGCLLAPYVLFLTRTLWVKGGEPRATIRNALNLLGIGTAAVSVVGLFMVSIFGNLYTDDLFYLHLVGAFVYFFLAIVFEALFTLSLHIANKRSKIQVIGTIASAVFGILCLLSMLPLATTYGIDGLLGFFMNKTPAERVANMTIFLTGAPWFPLTEWLFVLSTCAWFIITAVFTHKHARGQK
jgi:hypothetical protein